MKDVLNFIGANPWTSFFMLLGTAVVIDSIFKGIAICIKAVKTPRKEPEHWE